MSRPDVNHRPRTAYRRALGRCAVSGGCAVLAVCSAFLGTVLDSRGASASEQTRDDLADKLARREVQRARSSIPGREIVQVVTEIPPGVESGWHVHPGEEVGYIIVGNIEMMVQGRETVVLRAGDGFLIPPRTPHNALDLGPETGQMLSTYIVETDEPLATLVDDPR